MKLLSTYDDDNSIDGHDHDTLARRDNSGSSSSNSGSGSVTNDNDNYKIFRASDFFALSSYDTLDGSYLHHLFHSTSPESDTKKKRSGDGRGVSESSSVGSDKPILPVAQLVERNTSRTNWMLVSHYIDTPSQLYSPSTIPSRSNQPHIYSFQPISYTLRFFPSSRRLVMTGNIFIVVYVA